MIADGNLLLRQDEESDSIEDIDAVRSLNLGDARGTASASTETCYLNSVRNRGDGDLGGIFVT
ncbi:MAG: hypothetical protein WBL39_00805 [Terrimicrobiaceae bacterium]